MTIDEFKALCKQRRSVRYFADQPLSKETIEQLMEIASLAPSVENTQPWHFHIILNPDSRAKLMETSCYGNFVAGAGAFIVVSCDRSVHLPTQELIWNPKELEYSCATAMTYVLLGASCLGLGSCWVSLHHGKAHDILKLKDNHIIIGGIMLGHLKAGEEKPSGRHERRPVKEMYTFYE